MKKILSKKIILLSIISLTLIGGTTAFAVENNAQPIGENKHVDNPKPIFTANKNATGVSFKSKDEILKIVDKNQEKGTNSSVKSIDSKTWSQHISEDDPSSKDIDLQVDSDRNVWVVKTDYPNGLDTKAGFYDKATLTTVFDAETGQMLKSKVTGQYKGKNK